MKAMHMAALAALVSATTLGPARAGGPAPHGKQAAPGHAPMAPLGECMRAGRARDWGVVDATRLVVGTWDGRHYDIGLKDKCPATAKKAYLALTEGKGLRDGRICGELGDTVLPVSASYDRYRDRPCRIDSMRRIDKATFEQVFTLSPEQGRQFLDASPAYQGGADAQDAGVRAEVAAR